MDETHVYLLRDLNAYKIGLTNNISRRLRQLSTGNAYIRLVAYSEPLELKVAQWLEIELHTRYAHKRVQGEWFNLNPQDVKEVLYALGGQNPGMSLYNKFMWGLVIALSLTGAIIYVTMW